MNKIKFSHEYPKLHKQVKARLIDVIVITSDNLNDDLINYDTSYLLGDKTFYYKLPEGRLIQLIFIGEKGIPFCTIRRHTIEKEKYYKYLKQQIFDIIRT